VGPAVASIGIGGIPRMEQQRMRKLLQGFFSLDDDHCDLGSVHITRGFRTSHP
jgi:hypothetical protein